LEDLKSNKDISLHYLAEHMYTIYFIIEIFIYYAIIFRYFIYISLYYALTIGAFHLHQNSDKSHFCLSSKFMLKKDRSEIYLSFDVNGKHLL